MTIVGTHDHDGCRREARHMGSYAALAADILPDDDHRRQGRMNNAVTTPVARVTLAIPTRLKVMLKESASHPNSVMPSMASPMVPVLKTPNTRASRSCGVCSWTDAETNGVTSPELIPIGTTSSISPKNAGL